MAEALILDQVTKSFGAAGKNVRAVNGISLAIHENEFFTLLGPSGCGKTTLLRLVAGLEEADSGKISLFGQDITRLPAYKRPVNTVFQNYALFPHMSVFENVAFGLRMQKKGNIRAEAEDALRLVRMEEMRERKPGELSGGQQQRVALARALVNRPKILLLDEPLSALDYKLRKEMQQELKRLQRDTGITFIFVTHDQDEALSMSDRIAVMDQGKIAQTGAPPEIYHKPKTRFVADFIGDCSFLSPRAFGLEDEEDDLGFRPEDAAFIPLGEERSFSLVGKIVSINYKGSATYYMVMTHNGTIVTVAGKGHPPHRQDDHVRLAVTPEKLIRCKETA